MVTNGQALPVGTKMVPTLPTQTNRKETFQLYAQLLGLHTKLEISRLVEYVPSNNLWGLFGFHYRLFPLSSWITGPSRLAWICSGLYHVACTWTHHTKLKWTDSTFTPLIFSNSVGSIPDHTTYHLESAMQWVHSGICSCILFHKLINKLTTLVSNGVWLLLKFFQILSIEAEYCKQELLLFQPASLCWLQINLITVSWMFSTVVERPNRYLSQQLQVKVLSTSSKVKWNKQRSMEDSRLTSQQWWYDYLSV